MESTVWWGASPLFSCCSWRGSSEFMDPQTPRVTSLNGLWYKPVLVFAGRTAFSVCTKAWRPSCCRRCWRRLSCLLFTRRSLLLPSKLWVWTKSWSTEYWTASVPATDSWLFQRTCTVFGAYLLIWSRGSNIFCTSGWFYAKQFGPAARMRLWRVTCIKHNKVHNI